MGNQINDFDNLFCIICFDINGPEKNMIHAYTQLLLTVTFIIPITAFLFCYVVYVLNSVGE